MKNSFLTLLIGFIILSCNNKSEKKSDEIQLFKKLTSEQTGIDFLNEVKDSKRLSIIDYLYFYNGGGVAAGDINNDGLTDIFFSSNLGENKLYLNKGNLQFEDISDKAGISGSSDWNAGTVIADVNGDGWLDIYVCAVTGIFNFEGQNELYINNKDLTFTESAEQFGLNIKAYSSNAAFFDYDKDGDLDMYLLNHAVHTQDSYTPVENARAKYDYHSSDKFFRNEGDKFVDISRESGLIGGIISYGLGVRVADFNNDGWEDIYISNDFHEDDYFYLNMGDGTFKESGREYFAHMSKFSMGNDAADINNDGFIDLIVLDMLAEDEKVIKSSVGDDAYDTYQYRLKFGYNHQFARNVLQLNNAGKSFSEIALMSGVGATDWSWSPLFADYDNDGKVDLFVSTGIMRRPNDLDYIKYVFNEQVQKSLQESNFLDEKALDAMPSGKVHNYIFKGEDLKFIQKHEQWGMTEATISTGSAIADLDNDGDLDIIVNNLNEPSFIYENNAQTDSNAYLDLAFKGKSLNTNGLGAKAYLYSAGKIQYQQLSPYRGFQSSSQPILHFGLGNENVDSLKIIWADNTTQTIQNPSVNQLLVIQQESKTMQKYLYDDLLANKTELFTDVSDKIDFKHEENSFYDFNREKLLQYRVSAQGPALAVADVNGDGTDDIYLGGAKHQTGKLFLQKGGKFEEKMIPEFETDKVKEDVDAVFVDIDNDKDKDLIVLSAGNEFYAKSKNLADRTYINDGKGNFFKENKLPEYFENSACIRSADVDNDGDKDLFIGGRVVSYKFGIIPKSYLFINDGKGNFTDETPEKLKSIGMVTDALWEDLDQDNDLDLIVVGEWMKPQIFENTDGKIKQATKKFIDESLTGLWQEIEIYDIDHDGDKDILLGNWGLNSKLSASKKYPVKMYIKDVDKNGTIEQICAYAKDGKYYPAHTKDELSTQIVKLNKKFSNYSDYAGKTIEEIFSEDELSDADVLKIECFASGYYENNDGKYSFKKLPFKLQDAPILKFFINDLNNNQKEDLLIAGNLHGVTPYHGKFDANHGKIIFSNNPKKIITFEELGMKYFNKEVKNIVPIKIDENECFIFAINNDKPIIIKKNK